MAKKHVFDSFEGAIQVVAYRRDLPRSVSRSKVTFELIR